MAIGFILWTIIVLQIVPYTGATCENCLTCNSQNNTCEVCDKDFYRFNGGCRVCEHYCLANSSSTLPVCNQRDGYCNLGCKNGFYGSTDCSSPCSVTCLNQTCERGSGRCSFGCSPKYFSGDYCLDYCPAGCSDGLCTQDGDCLNQCKPNYYNNPKCDQTCDKCSNSTSEPERNCNITNGVCLHGCVKGFYGDMCTSPCSSACNDSLCERTAGHCLAGCSSTLFTGDFCQDNCQPGCSDGRCNQTGDCLNECKANYYNNPKCDKTCDQCSSNTGTTQDRKCDKTSGSCMHGCVNGFYGDMCTSPCSTMCNGSLCERTTGRCLLGCKSMLFTGDMCKDKCQPICSDGRCSQNGDCLNGCSDDTMWGSKCSSGCPSFCLNGKCSKNKGSCIEGCVDSVRWGDKCNVSCSANCTKNKCNHITGFCTGGCVKGSSWGNDCSHGCSLNCVNGTCNQTNGHCIDGCKTTQFWSPTCNETCSHCENGCAQSTGACAGQLEIEESSNWWMYIIIAGGLVVISAALVAVVVGTKRRSRGKKKFVDEEDLTVEGRSGRVNRPMRAVNALTTLFVQNPIAKMLQRGLTQRVNSAQEESLKSNKIENAMLLRTVLNMERSEIEVEFESFSSGFIKPFETATRNDNISKNTYTDIYPYDDNRVVLSNEDNKDTDYINASFIDGFLRQPRYIAAQGPSRQTKEDFWKMVWQEKVTCIVMFDNEGQMADKYLPEHEGADTYGAISVYSQSCENYADFVINMYKLTKAGEERRIVHMQFTDWQGGNPPSSPSSLIEFHQKYRSIVRLDENLTIVHCTAGVGRTGVFIALDYLVDEGLTTGGVDVYNCVSELRKQRIHMVQTQEQYEFLYQVVAQSIGLHCQLIPTKGFGSHKIDLEDQFQKCTESLDFDREEIPAMTFDQEVRRKDRPTSDIPGMYDPFPVEYSYARYRPTLASNKYINAVTYDTYRQKEGIIVTQMPTPGTVSDFCRLVKEKNCSTIIMLNRNDREKKSYGVYWPKKGSTTKYGTVHVTTQDIKELHTHTERILKFESKVNKVKETQEVKMIQFREWEDVNMIPEPGQLTELVRTVREHMNRNPGRPLLVHCLNGSEQSGLYCVMHDLLEKMLTENEISVINSVRKLKVRISQGVPTLDQFRLCYEAVGFYIAQEKANVNTNE